jgi:hypothetical protein
VKSGQFVKGKIDGIQKSFKSPGIRELLPKDKMAELEDITEVGEYPRFFKAEKVMAKAVVTPAENTDGRPNGTVNFTVLYKWPSTIQHETAPYIFDLDTFISEILAGKRQLKMPPFPKLPEGTDYGAIDPPPPLEWEGEP